MKDHVTYTSTARPSGIRLEDYCVPGGFITTPERRPLESRTGRAVNLRTSHRLLGIDEQIVLEAMNRIGGHKFVNGF